MAKLRPRAVSPTLLACVFELRSPAMSVSPSPAVSPGRSTASAPSSPAVSIVIPGLNESASLRQLAERIDEAIGKNEDYEIVFVDDGSTDDSWATIGAMHRENPRIRGLRMRRNFGKAMALSAGFREAHGEFLLMMDADLQDDPADIPEFLRGIREGADVVVGWKVKRRDPLNRRIASRIFNGTVGWTTGVQLHDMNCGFKAYRREVIETVPIYGDLFRFIPALAAADGYRVMEIPVRHHPRAFGTSRYGLERILRGFFDLLSVLFLTRYARRPMHLFGLIGLFTGMLGVALGIYLSVLWFLGQGIGARPLLLLAVLMMVLGVQFASMGFLGEFLTYHEEKRSYQERMPVRERL
jgi:glycosyltransferase involved in cell wall biosynthesis